MFSHSIRGGRLHTTQMPKRAVEEKRLSAGAEGSWRRTQWGWGGVTPVARAHSEPQFGSWRLSASPAPSSRTFRGQYLALGPRRPPEAGAGYEGSLPRFPQPELGLRNKTPHHWLGGHEEAAHTATLTQAHDARRHPGPVGLGRGDAPRSHSRPWNPTPARPRHPGTALTR